MSLKKRNVIIFALDCGSSRIDLVRKGGCKKMYKIGGEKDLIEVREHVKDV